MLLCAVCCEPCAVYCALHRLRYQRVASAHFLHINLIESMAQKKSIKMVSQVYARKSLEADKSSRLISVYFSAKGQYVLMQITMRWHSAPEAQAYGSVSERPKRGQSQSAFARACVGWLQYSWYRQHIQ